MNTFQQNLLYGQEGEHIIANLLISSSVVVLPLFQFTPETAPKLLGIGKQYTCPDLMCYEGSSSYFVEVKSKQKWVKFDGNLETGINQKHYDSYKALQDTTGITVLLFFIHVQENPQGIYCCRLGDFTRVWDGCYRGEYKSPAMVFYNHESLLPCVTPDFENITKHLLLS